MIKCNVKSQHQQQFKYQGSNYIGHSWLDQKKMNTM
jgi:hypothetical protein